jgi:hypothetical protein
MLLFRPFVNKLSSQSINVLFISTVTAWACIALIMPLFLLPVVESSLLQKTLLIVFLLLTAFLIFAFAIHCLYDKSGQTELRTTRTDIIRTTCTILGLFLALSGGYLSIKSYLVNQNANREKTLSDFLNTQRYFQEQSYELRKAIIGNRCMDPIPLDSLVAKKCQDAQIELLLLDQQIIILNEKTKDKTMLELISKLHMKRIFNDVREHKALIDSNSLLFPYLCNLSIK